jgi:hypothetical protein
MHGMLKMYVHDSFGGFFNVESVMFHIEVSWNELKYILNRDL